MKKIIIALLLFTLTAEYGFSQNINWRSLQHEQPNLISLNLGYDFGLTTQIGYYRYLNSKNPILLGADYSFPMGENLMDDFKLRFGGQIEVYEINGFSVTAKVLGNMRRYETARVRMASFGSEFSVLVGYYKPTWHVAGEFGFDKSIITHLEHSDTMRDVFPGIKDGWYIPSGGHFFYGIQGSKTLGKTFELSLRAGFTNAEGKDEDALLPYYGQLGLVKRF